MGNSMLVVTGAEFLLSMVEARWAARNGDGRKMDAGHKSQQELQKIEQQLIELVPQDQWTLFSHWLIWHGRRRCFARNPDCPGCELKALCPRIGVAKATASRV